MNLKKIKDKKDDFKDVEKKSKLKGDEAYKVAVSKFPDNFYVKLASTMYSAFNNKGVRGSKKDLYYPDVTIFPKLSTPNKVAFKNTGDSGFLIVNGFRCTAEGKGLAFVQNVITSLYQSEIKKEVKIYRPEGHTLKTDRLDFDKCEGTLLLKLSNSVAEVKTENSSRRSFASKGNINQEWMVTQEQVDEVDNFNPSGFDKHKNKVCTYYTKKGMRCLDFTGHVESIYQLLHCIFTPDSELDKVARDDIFDFLYKEFPDDPYIICVFEDILFVIEWHKESWWTLAKKKAINLPKIKFI